jgi:hypothetical protein
MRGLFALVLSHDFSFGLAGAGIVAVMAVTSRFDAEWTSLAARQRRADEPGRSYFHPHGVPISRDSLTAPGL